MCFFPAEDKMDFGQMLTILTVRCSSVHRIKILTSSRSTSQTATRSRPRADRDVVFTAQQHYCKDDGVHGQTIALIAHRLWACILSLRTFLQHYLSRCIVLSRLHSHCKLPMSSSRVSSQVCSHQDHPHKQLHTNCSICNLYHMKSTLQS